MDTLKLSLLFFFHLFFTSDISGGIPKEDISTPLYFSKNTSLTTILDSISKKDPSVYCLVFHKVEDEVVLVVMHLIDQEEIVKLANNIKNCFLMEYHLNGVIIFNNAFFYILDYNMGIDEIEKYTHKSNIKIVLDKNGVEHFKENTYNIYYENRTFILIDGFFVPYRNK